MLKLEFPELKHKKAYEKMIIEWWEKENLSEISPMALFVLHSTKLSDSQGCFRLVIVVFQYLRNLCFLTSERYYCIYY